MVIVEINTWRILKNQVLLVSSLLLKWFLSENEKEFQKGRKSKRENSFLLFLVSYPLLSCLLLTSVSTWFKSKVLLSFYLFKIPFEQNQTQSLSGHFQNSLKLLFLRIASCFRSFYWDSSRHWDLQVCFLWIFCLSRPSLESFGLSSSWFASIFKLNLELEDPQIAKTKRFW